MEWRKPVGGNKSLDKWTAKAQKYGAEKKRSTLWRSALSGKGSVQRQYAGEEAQMHLRTQVIIGKKGGKMLL